ncbi:hypothetical protein PFISCL1PPCAC_24557, partial [Pristionchus fissidentatus]
AVLRRHKKSLGISGVDPLVEFLDCCRHFCLSHNQRRFIFSELSLRGVDACDDVVDSDLSTLSPSFSFFSS